MTITVKMLEARKKELFAQQLQTIANSNALGGALQDIDYWIAALKAESVETNQDAPSAAEEQ